MKDYSILSSFKDGKTALEQPVKVRTSLRALEKDGCIEYRSMKWFITAKGKLVLVKYGHGS